MREVLTQDIKAGDTIYTGTNFNPRYVEDVVIEGDTVSFLIAGGAVEDRLIGQEILAHQY